MIDSHGIVSALGYEFHALEERSRTEPTHYRPRAEVLLGLTAVKHVEEIGRCNERKCTIELT